MPTTVRRRKTANPVRTDQTGRVASRKEQSDHPHPAPRASSGLGHLPQIKNNTTETINGTASADVRYPFVIDKWHDALCRGRVSVQVQLPSGRVGGPEHGVRVRVSTDQRSLVVNTPLSPYLARPEQAFQSHLAGAWPSASGGDPHRGTVTLHAHPKIIARTLAVARIVGRNDFTYEQRIPLPCQCLREWADSAGDALFHGIKLVLCPDGSLHLHVELVAATRRAHDVAQEQQNAAPCVMVHAVDPSPFVTQMALARFSRERQASPVAAAAVPTRTAGAGLPHRTASSATTSSSTTVRGSGGKLYK